MRQAQQVFENIKTVLGELGADMGDVLKTTVYLTNIAEFGEVNKLYAERLVLIIRRVPAWRFLLCRWDCPLR